MFLQGLRRRVRGHDLALNRLVAGSYWIELLGLKISKLWCCKERRLVQLQRLGRSGSECAAPDVNDDSHASVAR